MPAKRQRRQNGHSVRPLFQAGRHHSTRRGPRQHLPLLPSRRQARARTHDQLCSRKQLEDHLLPRRKDRSPVGRPSALRHIFNVGEAARGHHRRAKGREAETAANCIPPVGHAGIGRRPGYEYVSFVSPIFNVLS